MKSAFRLCQNWFQKFIDMVCQNARTIRTNRTFL